MAKSLASAEEQESPLRALPCPQRTDRAVVLAGTAGSGLFWVQWGEIRVKTGKGEEIPLAFAAWEDTLSRLSQEAAFAYLATEPFRLSEAAESLEWEQELYARGLRGLVGAGAAEVVVEVQLVEPKTGLPLAVLNRASMPLLPAECSMQRELTADISAYRGQEVALKISAQGLGATGDLVAAVAEVFIIENPFIERGQPKAEPQRASEEYLPLAFTMEQNYPNPFNPETQIRYELPEASHVTLRLYNLMGQLVRTLVDAEEPAGSHAVRWDGRDAQGQELASGVYLYQIKAGSFVATKKMLYLR